MQGTSIQQQALYIQQQSQENEPSIIEYYLLVFNYYFPALHFQLSILNPLHFPTQIKLPEKL